ncbi:MAG: hypothetical protein ABEJ61_08245 [Haloferacaceae archaeon]
MANEPRPRRPEADASRRPDEDAGQTWLDAVEEMLDATIERDEAFEFTFEEFEVDVPLRMGGDAPRARWGLDGTVRVHVEGTRGPLAEWLRWWHRRVTPAEEG